MITSAPPSNQAAWYHPGTYIANNNLLQAKSPRAPEYPVLDKVQLTLTSLYAGRAGSMITVKGLENRWELNTNALQTRGLMGKGAFAAAGKTVLVAGGLSVLRNMASLSQGDVNVARASGNVVADIATGAVGGLAAGAAGSLATTAFINGGAGVAGFIGTLAGAVGFVAADFLLSKTGVKGLISDAVTGRLEKADGQSSLPVELSHQQAYAGH